ncbi:MAG: Stp1/IreP family PP2C-type Ser/Thr phosphatase [Parasporobacterium sp.]|nr:Stp1/IreP family PP2C-type Ser/Thr phosphatase [Parasporobacterium sp.]
MKSYGITDIGLSRKYNQDYTLECDEPIGNLENLYVVCDGLGGHNAGEYASSTAAENFFDFVEFSESKMPLSIFKEAVLKTNRIVYDAGQEPAYQGMASTLVGVTVAGNIAYVVNVGDSRAYVIGPNEITQITWDHSYVAELVREGQITKDEARFHKKNNVITRAIGAEISVKPDFFQVVLEEDEILLVCTDGLYNMVSDMTIKSVVNSHNTLKAKAQRLIDLANEAGGKDNIAVVLISR